MHIIERSCDVLWVWDMIVKVKIISWTFKVNCVLVLVCYSECVPVHTQTTAIFCRNREDNERTARALAMFKFQVASKRLFSVAPYLSLPQNMIM
jgi:hypothetical protein